MSAPIGIIPASGKAVRLGGLPKFLLPIARSHSGYNTLLAHHLTMQKKVCERIIVSTLAEFAPLVYPIVRAFDAQLVVQETGTMSETVLRMTEFAEGDEFLLSMPDTFFEQTPGLSTLAQNNGDDLMLQCWKVPTILRGQVGEIELSGTRVIKHADKSIDSNFSHMWGAMRFRRSYLDFVQPQDAHVGIGISRVLERIGFSVSAHAVQGEYLDLGTSEGLRRFLAQEST